MKLLLYCTKATPMLRIAKELLFKHQDRAKCYEKGKFKFFTNYISEEMYRANGKIVAECDFEVEEIIANDVKIYDEYGIKYTTKNGYQNIDNNFEALLNNSCLNAFELNDYLGGYGGYAIHIKNLKIFDKPKELDDCEKKSKPIFDFTNNYYDDNYYELTHITKAPQNMCKVKLDDKPYILISIRPEYLVNILNGNKTIEIRKKILKEMLKNE